MSRKVYCKIKYKNGKKRPFFGKHGWGSLSKEEANAEAMITGGGVIVIDVDAKEIPKQWKGLFDEMRPTVETARGYHYYVKTSRAFLTRTGIIAEKNFNIDIRAEGGLVFTKYWGPNKDKISYKKIGKVIKGAKAEKFLKRLEPYLHVKKKVKKTDRGAIGKLSKKDVKRLLSKLNVLDYRDRDSWMKVVASSYHAGGSKVKNIVKKWSKNDTEKYDEKGFEQLWGQLESGRYGTQITTGTLIALSEQATSLEGDIVKEEVSEDEISNPLSLFKDIAMNDDDYSKIEAQRYFIEGFIPRGGLVMIYADAGQYKSWTTMVTIKDILEKHNDAHCIFFDHDSGAVYSRNRVQGLRHRFGNRFQFVSQDKHGAEEDVVLKRLKKAVKHNVNMDGVLIVFDSLTSYTEGKINDSSDPALKEFIDLLQALRACGATCVVIHHAKRELDRNGKPQYAGSYTIKRVMDVMYGVVSKDETIVIDRVKARGKYDEGKAMKVKNFEKLEYKEIDYKKAKRSIKEIEEENRRIEKVNSKEIEQGGLIRSIKRAIKAVSKDKHTVNAVNMVALAVSKETGLDGDKVKKLLTDYDGKLWIKKGVPGGKIRIKLLKKDR